MSTNIKLNETARAAMLQSGHCWITAGASLEHRDGHVNLWHNGFIIGRFPSDRTMCHGDVVNRLDGIWRWAVAKLQDKR